jgi:hypothetical protein
LLVLLFKERTTVATPQGGSPDQIVITAETIRRYIVKLETAVALATECDFTDLATEMTETLKTSRDILAAVEGVPASNGDEPAP